MRLFNTLFPAFSDTRREKPRDMLFVAHESVPMNTAAFAAAQHMLIAMMFAVYAVIAGEAAGLSATELSGFVALSIIVSGAVTLLQGLKTPFSSGHVVVHIPSPLSIATFVAVTGTYGLGAAAGGYIVCGVCVIVLARFLPRLQTIFPPEVTGVLLVLLGLELVGAGVPRFTGVQEGAFSISSLVVAGGVLFTVIWISVWAPARFRIFAMAIGFAVGLILAVATGVFGRGEVEQVLQQPVVGLPFVYYALPEWEFVLAAALPLLVIEVVSAIDGIGTGVAIDRLNNQAWRRPDLAMISRLVSCQGVGVILHGLTGTMSSATSSANIGLAHATGVAARTVGVVTGAMLVATAFLPSVATFLTLIPVPIMGALLVYTAGFMFVAGMQLILSRMINSRRSFMVGLSVTVGASISLIPELTTQLDPELNPILGSGITMGVICAVVLNAVFRIGVSQSATTELNRHRAGADATKFLEECGMDWGARGDVIARAGVAVGEAIEALNAADLTKGPVTLDASFDEFSLVLSLSYSGTVMDVDGDAGPVDLGALLEDDSATEEAFDHALNQFSGTLIRNLADQVESGGEGGEAYLTLRFKH